MPKQPSIPERAGLKALAAAERVLLDRFGATKPSVFGYKAHREIVTKADLAANKAILAVLKRETPDFDILSEEGGVKTASDWRWIVDPLDGTTNYTAQLPLWGVSIALEHHNEVVLGLMSIPCLRERYIARRGGGAWCFPGTKNPERLHAAKTSSLKESLGLLCYGYKAEEKMRATHAEPALIMGSRSVRRLGAAVVETAWVASGRADYALLTGTRPWDVASGGLLVQEAGGVAVCPNGKAWSTYNPDVLFCAPKLKNSLLNKIKGL